MTVAGDANACSFIPYGKIMIKKILNGILVNPPYKNYNTNLLSYDNVPMLLLQKIKFPYAEQSRQ